MHSADGAQSGPVRFLGRPRRVRAGAAPNIQAVWHGPAGQPRHPRAATSTRGRPATPWSTAGLELFAERGYAEVGTEEVVARAKVTRGALYHHFEDKRDLFRAVHERVEEDLVERIAAQMEGVSDPWEVMVTGTRAFLDACDDAGA